MTNSLVGPSNLGAAPFTSIDHVQLAMPGGARIFMIRLETGLSW